VDFVIGCDHSVVEIHGRVNEFYNLHGLYVRVFHDCLEIGRVGEHDCHLFKDLFFFNLIIFNF
jgi:hypothetical protein